jgi:hypothetical protein
MAVSHHNFWMLLFLGGMLLVIVVHFVDMRWSLFLGAAASLFVPGWLTVAALFLLNAGMSWYIKRQLRRFPPYTFRVSFLAILFTSMMLFLRLEELTASPPLWDIDAAGQIVTDCDLLAAPVEGGAITEFLIPAGMTAKDWDAIRYVSDILVSSLVERSDITNDNYLFLELRAVRAAFPDGVTRDAWYRAIVTDSTDPSNSVHIVFVEMGSLRPLMQIRNAGISPHLRLQMVYSDCGSPYGILASGFLLTNQANTISLALLIPLVIGSVFLLRETGQRKE